MAAKKVQKIYRFDELPDILTLEEAGLLINYNADYLRKRAAVGAFPAFQLFDDGERGEWRIYKEDLQEWLNAKRQKAKEHMCQSA
ncbi:MAG: helix-turn-helix domain-containing protein [Ruminococcus flavefaciens]|nr:helix-turn-helix domain-containing protein [Ruminococcus flavefaciens]